MNENRVRENMWDAYRIAIKESNDPRTRNGALLVQEGWGKVCGGWNYRIPSSDSSPESKYIYTEHAERDVIYRAARLGYATGGLILFCPWAACPECARAIILAGIQMVYVHQQALNRTPERWEKQVELGLDLLQHNEVRVVPYDGKVFPDGSFKALLDGQKWSP